MFPAARGGAATRRLSALAVSLAAAGLLGGCINLAPDYQRPAAPVPDHFVAPQSGVAAPANGTMPNWQALVLDEDVRHLVELALANNRDLRIAAANVERARQGVTVARADMFPTIGAGLVGTRAPIAGPNGKLTEYNTFTAGLQLSPWELDLFGRVRNATESARANLAGAEYAQRSARLTVVTQTLSAAFALSSAYEGIALAQSQLAARDESLRLTKMRFDAGAASALEYDAAQSLSASARIQLATAQRAAAEDRDALAVLIGMPVPATYPRPLPAPPPVVPGPGGVTAAPQQAPTYADPLAPVPANLGSEVLLGRPDVMQAEETLVAANASIGSARAAMFPQLSLTGEGGLASSTLSGLFSDGVWAYTLTGSAVMTLIDWGRNSANVEITKAERDAAVSAYELTLQEAFRDVSDTLSGLDTWRDQVAAARVARDADAERNRLTHLRFDLGAASLLELIDAERTQDEAEVVLLQARAAELQNRVALYRALGGDEAVPPTTAAAR
jgi:NodT family efflux transporter outer membrane factor (OMF) lipoprotein